MATLKEGDFELDGYVMGDEHPLNIMSFDPDAPGVRNQDIVNPVGDNRHFGRDYGSGALWQFLLGTANRDRATAVKDLGVAATYWRKTLQTPGAESTLRFRLAGQDRCVFGRVKSFPYSPLAPEFGKRGYIPVEASFQTSTPYIYDDVERVAVTTMTASSRGGLVGPLRGKLTAANGTTRNNVIPEVGGDLPAPFVAVIKGPIANPRINTPEWNIELTATLRFDESVTIDTRKCTVLKNDGSSLAGKLTRQSRLSTARLKPGPSNIKFGGTDASGRATCTVSWRPTYYGF